MELSSHLLMILGGLVVQMVVEAVAEVAILAQVQPFS
jgi:hypothetical protein